MSGPGRRRSSEPTLWLSACVLLLSAGCRREESAGPPDIVWGQDACARCDMIINEEGYAAGAAVRGADGRLRTVGFDDIGCLLDYAERSPDSIVVPYVKDRATLEWCRADRAVYVQGAAIRTPMASGLVAFASRQAAERVCREHNGRLLTYAELRAGRKPTSGPAIRGEP